MASGDFPPPFHPRHFDFDSAKIVRLSKIEIGGGDETSSLREMVAQNFNNMCINWNTSLWTVQKLHFSREEGTEGWHSSRDLRDVGEAPFRTLCNCQVLVIRIMKTIAVRDDLESPIVRLIEVILLGRKMNGFKLHRAYSSNWRISRCRGKKQEYPFLFNFGNWWE